MVIYTCYTNTLMWTFLWINYVFRTNDRYIQW